MLSISQPKCASNGMEYFEVDSYYSMNEKYGQWFGIGAQQFGLSGSINSDDFNKILNGEKIVDNAMDKDRCAYIDCTFSCPKSVSLLSYTDDRIESIHNAAVEKALHIVEDEYSITRIGAQGKKSIRTGNIIAARFNHYESRELDPQLHTHCVLMNLTQGEDEKWRSFMMGEIYKNKLYLGQVYRNELANELKKLGYTIEVTDRAKGVFDIEGVDKEIIDEFSKRRKQILEAKTHYDDYAVSEAEKLAYACLDSRKYKNKTTIEELRSNVEEALQKHNTSLEQIKEESLRVHEKGINHMTPEQCISDALEDITENKSAFRREDILSLAMKNGLGFYTVKELKTAFDENKEIKRLGEKNILIGKGLAPDVSYYTTNEMERIERGILRNAEYGKDKSTISIDRETIDCQLKERSDLSLEQIRAISMVCTSRDTLNLIQGDSGAGKTYAVNVIREIMNNDGYTVRGFAPTGKATVELRSAQIETSTIDSFLQSSKEAINKNELWIVDEAGMLGSRKLSRFLREAEQYNAKVVLIGDTKQFTSIDQGKIFADLQEHSTVGYAEITEVRRQKTAHMKEIVQNFKKRNTANALQKMQDHGLVHEIKNRNTIIQTVSNDYLADRAQGTESIIVSTVNIDKNALNAKIRSELTAMDVVEQGTDFSTFQPVNVSGSARRYANSYREKQVIFFQRDIKDAGIKRGTQAEIRAINNDENTLSVRYWDKDTSAYREQNISLFDHATKLVAFDVKRCTFGAGDQVLFQKNDKAIGVQNGLLGVITSIDESGNATVAIPSEVKLSEASKRLGEKGKYYSVRFAGTVGEIAKGSEGRVIKLEGKRMTVAVKDREHTITLKDNAQALRFIEHREVKFNISNRGSKAYNYLDYGYAVTSYDSQGCSIDTVRWLPDASQHTSYNEAYVAITRARHDAHIYTGDFNTLKEAAAVEQQKDSVLDFRLMRPREDDFKILESMKLDCKVPVLEIAINKTVGEVLDRVGKNVKEKAHKPLGLANEYQLEM